MKRTFRFGVQLWTLRDDWNRDPHGTLRRLAELGYEGIELYGDLPAPAEVLKTWLDALGLQVAAAHVGSSLDFPRSQRIEEARILGHNHFVFSFPSDPFTKDESTHHLAEAALDMASRLAEKNVRMSLHHHEWEFASPSRGQEFFKKCSPIGLEFDLFWLATAGLNPVEIVKQHAQRISLLHAKDGTPKRGLPMVAVGQGKVPVAAAIQAAIDASAPLEWVLVELDEWEGDVWQAIADSKAYLDKVF